MRIKGEKILTKKQVEEIKELYLSGYNLSEIGRMFNRNHSTISYYIEPLKNLPRKSKMSKELEEEKKISPNIGRRYLTKLTPKGLTYKDYLRIDREKELKKLCKKHL